jgi:hypothetical protein
VRAILKLPRLTKTQRRATNNFSLVVVVVMTRPPHHYLTYGLESALQSPYNVISQSTRVS